MSDLNAGVVRRVLRALVLTPAVLLLVGSAPAFAAPPEAWPDGEAVGALDFLLVLVVIPLALALVIAVLVYVPNMVRGGKAGSAAAWRNEREWFGGPKDGVDAADQVETEQAEGAGADRGGASARW